MSGTNAFFGEDKKDISNAKKTNLEDSFINLIGHINRGRQVFISKIYFHHLFDLIKNWIFPHFLPIFRAKFVQKAQNIFSYVKNSETEKIKKTKLF